MEFSEVGKNCNFKLCNQLDFLPIKCDHCKLIFCNLHNIPSNHECQNFIESDGYQQLQESKSYNYLCSVSGCKKGELTPVICEGCRKNFCLQHRHMTDHKCVAYVAPTNPMSEANEKIQNLTSQLKDCKAPRRTTKNDKLAAKINLMKMKGKAIGNKGVPQDERLYFSVRLPKSMERASDLLVFVSKMWSIGRTIDAIAELGNVVNKNNESLTMFLGLFRASDGSAIQPLSESMQSLIENEFLFSGQLLIMEYGIRGLEHLENFKSYS